MYVIQLSYHPPLRMQVVLSGQQARKVTLPGLQTRQEKFRDRNTCSCMQ